LKAFGACSDGLLRVRLPSKDITKKTEGQLSYTSYIYGFIDKHGKSVILPRFQLARDFTNGLAAVRLNNKWGFIDTKGNFVIEPIYIKVGDVSERIIAVNTDGEFGKWGYINTKGEWIWKPTR